MSRWCQIIWRRKQEKLTRYSSQITNWNAGGPIRLTNVSLSDWSEAHNWRLTLSLAKYVALDWLQVFRLRMKTDEWFWQSLLDQNCGLFTVKKKITWMLQWHFYKKWNTEALHSIVFDQNCIRFFLIKADSLFFFK